MWVDGAGPSWYTGAAILAADTTPAPTPAFGVIPLSNAQRFLNVDWIHAERVTGIVAPST